MSKPTYVSDLELAEHDKTYGVKKTRMYGYDGANLVGVKVNSDGSLVSDSREATNIEGGGKVSVGTTAVEATFTGTPQSIIISADPANTGTLYVGKSTVTT